MKISEPNSLVKEVLRDAEINDGNLYKRETYFSFVIKSINDLSADKANIDWVWEGYLARGHLTFLSALWKAGKSTLIAHLLKSLQEENEFAGQKIKKTNVLLLTEESEGIWARRREDLGLGNGLWLSCRPFISKLSERQWEKLIQDIADICEEKALGLVVVDTISTFWPVRDEGNNPELDEALIPLNVLLEKDIAVLLIHHFRKSGGTEGTATRGGGGLGSRADILLELTRLDAENINSTQRVLKSYSRFEESPPELVIELTPDGFVGRGTRSDVSKQAKIENITAILSQKDNLTIKEILQEWEGESYGSKPTIRTIRNYVDVLLFERKVIQTGKRLVNKSEAATYSLSNEGKESLSYNKISVVNQPSEEKLDDVQEFEEMEIEEL